jgi:Cu/Ag efflux protein CusF
MKKLTALIVALLFAFAVSAVSFAAEKPAEAPKPAPAPEKKAEPAKPAPAPEKKAEAKPAEKKAPAKVKQITGEVTAVDAAAKSVTVKGKKAEVVISADEKMLADVKVGDKVVAKYAEQDGKNVAKSIKKAAAKAEKKPAAAPAPEKKAEPAKPAEAPKK